MPGKAAERLAIVASICLLGLAGSVRLSMPKPADAAAFHERVLAASLAEPRLPGDWTVQEVPVPTEASAQLRPNVLISRRYTDAAAREQFNFLFVQTRDVRDLTPHYPPMCYPGRGLALTAATPITWALAGGATVHATVYEFGSISYQQSHPLIVYNLMILPDGRICADMDQVRDEAVLANRYYGAAQVQIVFTAAVSPTRRDAIAAEVLAAYRPLIDAARQQPQGRQGQEGGTDVQGLSKG